MALSITDNQVTVFPDGSNNFPECTGTNLQNAKMPFDIEIISSGINMNQNGNEYTFSRSTTGPITFEIKIKLDCSLSKFIKDPMAFQYTYSNATFYLKHVWQQKVQGNYIALCDGSIAIDQTQINENNGTAYNNAIDIGYNETKFLLFKYMYKAAINGADMALAFGMQANGTVCNNLPFSIDRLRYSIDAGQNWVALTTGNSVTWVEALTGDNELWVEVEITMNECANNCDNNDIVATLSYGCDQATYSSQNFCTECDELITTFVNFENKEPAIEYERISPVDLNTTLTNNDKILYEHPYDVSCEGNGVAWQYKVVNTGSVTAKYIKVTVQEPTQNAGLILMDGGVEADFIDANATNASIDNFTTIGYTGTLPACSLQLQQYNPISGFSFEILELKPNDYVLVNFKTRKCCAKDNVDFENLFNNPKNYNQFYLTFITLGICSDKFVPKATNNDNILSSGAGISTYRTQDSKPEDINMKTTFFPSMSNTIVFPANEYTQPNCSLKSASVIPNLINVNDFVGNIGTLNEYDLQALGYEGLLQGPSPFKPDYKSSIKLKYAYLKVKITCESGLQMDVSNSNISFATKYDFIPYFISGAIKWVLNYSVAIEPSFNCSLSHSYLFFFRMDDLLQNSAWGTITPNPITFIENSAFRFNMFPCCTLDGGNVGGTDAGKYKVEFSMLGNCGNNPPDINAINYNSPLFCWLPLKREEDRVQINCPGCFAPGLITENYYMRRTNLGYKDANDNQLADLSSTKITYAPTIAAGQANYTNFDLLTHSAVTHGDEVEDHFVSYFKDGDNGAGNYNYATMTSNQASLKCLQILRKIPSAGSADMNLQVTGFDFYIDDVNSVSTNCVDCDKFESYTGYETKFVMHVNDMAAAFNININLMEQDGNGNYLFTINDFDIANGKSNANHFFSQSANNTTTYHSTFPSSNYKYAVDERYRLVIRYRACGNIVSLENYINAITKAEIENDAYLIGTKLSLIDALGFGYPKMPNNIELACMEPQHWTFNGIDPCTNANSVTPVDQSFANAYKFKCEVYGCKIYFISTGVSAHTKYWTSGCDANLETKTVSTLGDPTNDCFAFEVKPPPFIETNWHYNLPSLLDYTHTISTFRAWDKAGNLSNSYTSTISPGNNFIDIKLTDNNGANQFFDDYVIADENFSFLNPRIHDQRSTMFVKSVFAQKTCTPQLATYIYTDLDANVHFIESNAANTMCALSFDKNIIPTDPPVPNKWKAVNPNVALKILPPTDDIDTKKVTWTFTITNDNTSGNHSNAPFVFLTMPPAMTSHFINIALTQLNYNSVAVPPPLINNSEFQLGLLETDGVYTGKIEADYAPCFTANHLQLDFSARWACLSNGPACTPPSTSSSILTNSPTQILVTLNNPNSTFTLCSANNTLAADFTNYSENNAVFPQDIVLNTNNGIFNITGCEITDCNGGSPQSVMPVNNIILATDVNAALTNLGLIDQTGLYLINGACFSVNLVYEINCTSISPLAPPNITFNYLNYCGDLKSAKANFLPIPRDFDNPSICTECYTIVKSANPGSAVINQETVTYTITVTSFNGASTTVSLNDDILSLGSYSGYMGPVFPINNLNFSGWQAVSTTTYSLTWISPTPIVNIKNTATLSTGLTALQSDTANVMLLTDCSDNVNGNIIPSVIGNDLNGTTTYTSLTPLQQNDNYWTINGTLEIDAGVVLLNKHIYVNPGGQIKVKNNKSLVLLACDLQACTKMWKGISLEEGTNILLGGVLSAQKFGVTNTVIKDAQFGVEANNLTALYLRGTTFENNFIGLSFPKPVLSNSPTSSVAFVIDDTEIRNTAPLATNYVGQFPTAFSNSYAGILSYANQLVIMPQTKNTFTNLSNGIVAYNTNLRISNTVFTDIQPDINYAYYYPQNNNHFNGSAIYDNCSKTHSAVAGINQVGYGNAQNSVPSFINCHIGINAFAANVQSSQNNMQLMGTAYHVKFNQNKSSRIEHNRMDTKRNAIELYFNDAAHNNIVWDNDIVFGQSNHIDQVPWYAIHIEEHNTDNNNSQILGNRINFPIGFTSAFAGIFANAANTWTIADNNITLWQNQYNKYGIRQTDMLWTTTTCNTVTGSGNLGFDPSKTDFGWEDQSAISNTMGDNLSVGCNDLNGTENGMQYLGPIPNIVVEGNNMRHHMFGWHNTLSNVMPSQYVKGNLWNNDPVLLTGFHAKNSNPNFDPGADYYTYHNGTNTYPVFNPPIQDPPNWFQLDPFNDDMTCVLTNGDNYCSTFRIACDTCADELDRQVARNEITNNPYTPETVWQLQWALYFRLYNNPTLLGDSLFAAYFAAMNNSLFPAIADITEEMRNLYLSDSLMLQYTNANDYIIKAATDTANSLMEQDSTNMANGQYNTSTFNAIHYWLMQVQNLQMQNDSLYALIDTMQVTQAENISVDVNSLSPTEPIADDELTISNIYLNTIARGVYFFTNLQQYDIHRIAAKCPIEGGAATYKARAMEQLYASQNHYNDRDLCDRAGIPLRKPNVEKQISPSFKIYPNPTSYSFTVEYTIEKNCEAVLYITNSIGQAQLTKAIDNNKNSIVINSENYASGIYSCRIICAENILYQQKLIIIK